MSECERITLSGGPANSTTQEWDGGDFLELVVPHPLPSGFPAGKHIYRRALYMRDTFTYQGVQP